MVNGTALRLGAILQEARDAQSKTQEHLAAEAGVSVQTVRRAEQTGTVSAESLRAMCAALGLDAADIRERAALSGASEPPDFIRIPGEPAGMDGEPGTPAVALSFCLMLAAVVAGLAMLIMGKEAGEPVWVALPSLLVAFGYAIITHFSFLYNASFRDAADETSVAELLAVHRSPIGWTVIAAALLLQWLSRSSVPASVLIVAAWVAQSRLDGILISNAHARIRAEDERALATFHERFPEILADLRRRVSRPLGEDGVLEMRNAAKEAAALAAAARRRNAAWPLVFLADDAARGMSPRKGLQRYLDVAETLGAPAGTVSDRRIRDAHLAVEQFRLRSSVFC